MMRDTKRSEGTKTARKTYDNKASGLITNQAQKENEKKTLAEENKKKRNENCIEM